MEQIGILVRLKLPKSIKSSQRWEALLQSQLRQHGQLAVPSLFMDEEQEVMNVTFEFKGIAKLKGMMTAIAETGAVVFEQFFKFPASFIEQDFLVANNDHAKFCAQIEDVDYVVKAIITDEELLVQHCSSESGTLLSLVKMAIANCKRTIDKEQHDRIF